MIKAEFSIYKKLLGGEFIPSIQDHSIYQLIKGMVNIYWSDFLDKGVKIEVDKCKHRILADYESIIAVFVHIFENALKYIKFDSTFNVRFCEEVNGMLKVSFDMISIKVEEEDKERMYEEGYSGRIPKKLGIDGNGTGMFIIKQFLDLNNISFDFQYDVDVSKRTNEMKIPFENNVFNIYLKRGHF